MSIKSKPEIIEMAKKQLAADLACLPEQFDREENSIVFSRLMEGRRRFYSEEDFFRIATFGHGTVISIDGRLLDWCEERLKNHSSTLLFENHMLYAMENEMRKYAKHIFGVFQYYLPLPGFMRKRELCRGALIKWYEKDDIPALYSYRSFENALLYENELRRDVLAAAAVMDGKMVAMAGASMDSELFWQIGVDVMPGYRNNGLATYLVGALTDEILKRGVVPYYGAWSANIISRNVAAVSGYFPAWVETYARDL